MSVAYRQKPSNVKVRPFIFLPYFNNLIIDGSKYAAKIEIKINPIHINNIRNDSFLKYPMRKYPIIFYIALSNSLHVKALKLYGAAGEI